MAQTRPWFAAKDPGPGATPATWEGWLSTLAFILLLTATSDLMDPRANSLGGLLRRLPGLHGVVLDMNRMLIAIGVESALFIAFCRWKSDGPWFPGARPR